MRSILLYLKKLVDVETKQLDKLLRADEEREKALFLEPKNPLRYTPASKESDLADWREFWQLEDSRQSVIMFLRDQGSFRGGDGKHKTGPAA
jgi:hypothetical protein